MQYKPANFSADFADNTERSLAFASYYGDHMVLQQIPKRSIVWGYAGDTQRGQKVKMTLSDDHGYIKMYEVTINKGKIFYYSDICGNSMTGHYRWRFCSVAVPLTCTFPE